MVSGIPPFFPGTTITLQSASSESLRPACAARTLPACGDCVVGGQHSGTMLGIPLAWHWPCSQRMRTTCAQFFLCKLLLPCRTAVAAEDNRRLITVTWPVPVPPMCLALALGTRVCALRVDSAEVLYTTVSSSVCFATCRFCAAFTRTLRRDPVELCCTQRWVALPACFRAFSMPCARPEN